MTAIKRTPLYGAHLELDGRMVDFAGWDMPIQYPSGINQEHIAVRQKSGLFDVSHMGEIRVLGTQATEFLQYATLNDPAKLKPGRGQYSMLPNDKGGLIDDLYIYCDKPEEYLVVCNASNTPEVVKHLKTLAETYEVYCVDESANWALLALQGPAAALQLGRHTDSDLAELKKNRFIDTEMSAVPVRIARTGYTGEDGFEIFCHPTDATIIWGLLVETGATPCGLGARDTLRLEAGFPLYGHELTPTTNPLCTDYAWVVKDKPFYGREAMWNPTCKRRLVGLRLLQRGICRQGYRVLYEGQQVGEVSSGTISPLTRESIAMAWIDAARAELGSALEIEIRGVGVPATVVKPPFYS